MKEELMTDSAEPQDPRDAEPPFNILKWALIVFFIGALAIVVLALLGPATGNVFSGLAPSL
jgi:hypothetical protein